MLTQDMPFQKLLGSQKSAIQQAGREAQRGLQTEEAIRVLQSVKELGRRYANSHDSRHSNGHSQTLPLPFIRLLIMSIILYLVLGLALYCSNDKLEFALYGAKNIKMLIIHIYIHCMSVYALHDRHIEQRDVQQQMCSSATNFTWMFTP